MAEKAKGAERAGAPGRASPGSGLCPSSAPLTLLPVPQEALHRELLLKQKMVILQELLSTLLQASEKSWQVPESCRAPQHLPCLAASSLLGEAGQTPQERPFCLPAGCKMEIIHFI